MCKQKTQHISLLSRIQWGLDACSGLIALHDRLRPHRDVKPDNLAVADVPHGMKDRFLRDDDRIVKLMDLGFSKKLAHEDDMVPGRLGTQPYCAPEMWGAKPENGLASDIYSLGCVLYELCADPPQTWDCQYTALRKDLEAAAAAENRTCALNFDVHGLPAAVLMMLSRAMGRIAAIANAAICRMLAKCDVRQAN